jgi:hypothetical protein
MTATMAFSAVMVIPRRTIVPAGRAKPFHVDAELAM